jgi:hypothetical protein
MLLVVDLVAVPAAMEALVVEVATAVADPEDGATLAEVAVVGPFLQSAELVQ